MLSAMPSRLDSCAMLYSLRSPQTTILILSSSEYYWRVAQRMYFTACLDVPWFTDIGFSPVVLVDTMNQNSSRIQVANFPQRYEPGHYWFGAIVRSAEVFSRGSKNR
jgi:hypothetical protein